MLYFGGSVLQRCPFFSYLVCLDPHLHELKITQTVRDEEKQGVSHKE